MKFSWKNIENWRSWKMSFFWGGHFEFFKSAILNFFLLHLCEKSSPFIWGNIFFCTMDGFSRILEKKLCHLLCTRLYWEKVPDQKYSRLRCLLRVKGLVIGFYLGWSGHTLLIRKIIMKVGSKSLLLTCSSNKLWAYLYYIFLIRRES